jgi:hypothetical protein
MQRSTVVLSAWCSWGRPERPLASTGKAALGAPEVRCVNGGGQDGPLGPWEFSTSSSTHSARLDSDSGEGRVSR